MFSLARVDAVIRARRFASFLPAHRAASVNPIEALRTE
jgi:ABC-type lipoprotein release transport system permease subunit